MKEFLKDAPAIKLLLIYLDVATYFSLIYSYLDSKIIKQDIYRSLQSIHKESSICKVSKKKVIVKFAKRICKIIDKRKIN